MGHNTSQFTLGLGQGSGLSGLSCSIHLQELELEVGWT